MVLVMIGAVDFKLFLVSIFDCLMCISVSVIEHVCVFGIGLGSLACKLDSKKIICYA